MYQKEIAGFEISMNDVGRVHIEKPFEHLPDKILNMLVWEVLLGVDDSVEVGFHEFSDDVDVFIARSGSRT